jgi:uncharacterized protein (TIGR04141 family)
MPKKAEKKRQLTIYLLREGLGEEAIDLDKVADTVEVAVAGAGASQVYIKAPASNVPRWVSFFPSIEALSGLFNASSSALLLVPCSGRAFAISFGHGRYLLRLGSTEENFGLKVTLNAVSAEKIRSIDKKTFDAIASQTREQALTESPMAAFVLDGEQDVLRAVVGGPANPADGCRLAGRDALIVSGNINLSNLAGFLERYLSHSESDAYSVKFPWVDRVREERDRDRKEQLNAALIEKLRTGNLASCYLAVPEIIEWDRIEGFNYLPEQEEPAFDLRLPELLDQTRAEDISIEWLKSRHVRAMDPEGGQVQNWLLYRCLNAELVIDGRNYLLSNGRWYQIDADFVAQVDDYFRALPMASLDLPRFRENSESEADYNRRVANEVPGLALVDRKLISYQGSDRIEFCDLYSSSKQLIHVKRYGGSSVLSHLFAQGVVAASLLHEPGFREKVNEQLPDSHRLPVEGRLAADQYEIVYAIVSQSPHPLWIPFFSRVNLRQAVRQLHQRGFRVALAKVATVADGCQLDDVQGGCAPSVETGLM